MNDIIDTKAQEQEQLEAKLTVLFRDILKKAQKEVAERIEWYRRRFETEEKATQSLLNEYKPKLMNDEFATQIIVEYDFSKASTEDDYINYLVPFFVNYIPVLVPTGQDDEYIKSTAEVLMAYWVVKQLQDEEQDLEYDDPEDLTIRTRKIIIDQFGKFGKTDWQFAFLSESDFNLFVDILTAFFTYEEYILPNVIQLTRDCKTELATILKSVHKELGNIKLSKDEEFLKIIRVLSHYKDDKNLYKTISR